jgi:hypothetical protein
VLAPQPSQKSVTNFEIENYRIENNRLRTPINSNEHFLIFDFYSFVRLRKRQ